MQSDVNTDEEEAGLYKVQELMNEPLGERNCEGRGTGERGTEHESGKNTGR